jgi:bifunctional enzyme CysN/CysC
MPVQSVNRPNLDFRGFCGRIAEGELRPGDSVRVLPSGVQTRIKSILAGFDEVPFAQAGDAVTITLADEVDASRGDVLVASDNPPEVADQFEAKLLWMAEHAWPRAVSTCSSWPAWKRRRPSPRSSIAKT